MSLLAEASPQRQPAEAGSADFQSSLSAPLGILVAAGIANTFKMRLFETAPLCLQARLDKKMTQAQLAQAINEKPQIIQV